MTLSHCQYHITRQRTEDRKKNEGGEGNKLGIIDPRLQHNSLSSEISQPAIMHESRKPNSHTMRAPVFLLADEEMNTAVVVICSAE